MGNQAADGDILSALHVVEYPYQRSTGPVIGRFLAALKDRRIEGVKGSDGRVLVPPTEYDPLSGEPLGEFVEVGQAGVVTAWSWLAEPRPGQPLTRPFAWALVRLDGADTGLLHAVDAGDESRMHTGMRVRVRWREETSGEIQDIACFEPAPGNEPASAGAAAGSAVDPVTRIRAPMRLEYKYTAGRSQSRFLRGMAEGRILGQRCPQCGKVYVPPRGSCPVCAVATDEEVELSQRGTVTTFCIVNIPSQALSVPVPYVCADILLDGAAVPFFHLIQECPPQEVRMGMRVEAVWAAPEELRASVESIRHFRPANEPDVPVTLFPEGG